MYNFTNDLAVNIYQGTEHTDKVMYKVQGTVLHLRKVLLSPRRGQPRGASASRPGSAQEAPVAAGVRGGSRYYSYTLHQSDDRGRLEA